MEAAELAADAPPPENPRHVRNTCILAHVDHGKTTLADHLVASCGDGLLHPRLAGRLRFMDYLDEEQRRAITMKSAAVLLRYGGDGGDGVSVEVALLLCTSALRSGGGVLACRQAGHRGLRRWLRAPEQ